MTTQILRGSNRQIAKTVAGMRERVLEAILLVDDPPQQPEALSDAEFERLMEEMDAHSVAVGNANFSRESIYMRHEGE
jgi:hypothetical protein